MYWTPNVHHQTSNKHIEKMKSKISNNQSSGKKTPQLKPISQLLKIHWWGHFLPTLINKISNCAMKSVSYVLNYSRFSINSIQKLSIFNKCNLRTRNCTTKGYFSSRTWKIYLLKTLSCIRDFILLIHPAILSGRNKKIRKASESISMNTEDRRKKIKIYQSNLMSY